MSIATDALFVYGTLAPGRANESKLAGLQGEWEQGYVCGWLVEYGWGATQGFPAIRIDKDGPKVHGFVLSSRDLVEVWDELDRFEGPEYERVLTMVTLKDGSQIKAYIYQAKQSDT